MFIKLLFYKFGTNIVDSFRGRNVLYHILAIVSTYIFVVSGFDWKYLQFFWGNFMVSIFIFSAVMFGMFVPFLIMISLLLYGKIMKNLKLLYAGFAMGQAAIMGYLISILYKTFTGRIGPQHSDTQSELLDVSLDLSTVFDFGIYQGGIYEGWPSSHTTVAFAMAFALFFALYPKNKIIGIFAVLFALYIGIGTSMTIHWFSDFTAGAIIGTVVGLVVGKAFKRLT